MVCLATFRRVARRHRVLLVAWLLAMLALPQAAGAARVLLAGDLPPSMLALCSSSGAPTGGPGDTADHTHDCCVFHGLGMAPSPALPSWRLPAVDAATPPLARRGPRRMAAWAPQLSRAPPAPPAV